MAQGKGLGRGAFIALGVLVLVAGVYGARRWQHARTLRQPIPAELVDIAPVRLAQPDALIVSSNLRELPRDLLAVPALKAALSEDFVFYYEENEGLLGLKGSLRRIAYEHQLSLADEAVAMLLEHPGDVALWRGTSGKIEHWMINATRTDAAALLQAAAKVATGDTQLSVVGRLPLAEGGDTPLYKIEHARGRALLFAGHGDKLIVLSDAALYDGAAFGSEQDKAPVWKALFDPRWPASPLRRHFGLADFAGKHALVVGADAVSFNYRQLVPAVEALRFDFDGTQWQSWMRLGAQPDLPDRYDTRKLWATAPADAALCVAAPLQWSTLQPVFADLKAAQPAIDPALLDALATPAGVCWYADAGMYSPLVLVPVKAQASTRDAVAALFGHSIAKGVDGTDAEVESTTVGKAQVWRKHVETELGDHQVSLALSDGWLLFSPRTDVVDAALAVLEKQRPALADTLPADAHVVAAVVTPQSLSRLLRRVVEGDLPEKTEPLFRAAAQTLLLPRLEALGQFPAYAVSLSDSLATDQRAWQAVQWQSLPASR